MRIASLILAAVVLTGCATIGSRPERVLSVDEVRANYRALDGKRIAVQGVLKGCGGWSCRLDADDPRGGNSLQFDSQDSLRKKLKPYDGRKVTLRATFDAFCFGPAEGRDEEGNATIRVCMDAATHLKNPEIIEIR